VIAPLMVLARVPGWAWALVALALWGGWQRVQLVQVRAEMATAIARAQGEAAQETARRLAAQEEIVREHQAKAERARRDAAAAAGAAGRLRARLDAVHAEHTADTTAAAVRSAADTAAAVLADMLGRCSDRRTELAGYADQAAGAGRACERAYDALSATP